MRRERSGLTLIEILVVVSVIAILIGILIPALGMVQKAAREVKQKGQFTAIDLGLAAFRSDYGDYPPSDWWNPRRPSGFNNYCGAQKLAEALLGWDLLGFHPDSAWRGDGLDASGGPETYDPAGVYKNDAVVYQERLKKRRDRYIEMDVANPFRLRESLPGLRDGLFADVTPLAFRTYVLCDVFEVPQRKLKLDALDEGRSVVPGTPILYYKANPASKTINTGFEEDRIYNVRDNAPLISLGQLADWDKPVASRRQHLLNQALGAGNPYFPSGSLYFYEYIRDPKVQSSGAAWPCRPDTYLLISAGRDGLYGTPDDMRNFGRH